MNEEDCGTDNEEQNDSGGDDVFRNEEDNGTDNEELNDDSDMVQTMKSRMMILIMGQTMKSRMMILRGCAPPMPFLLLVLRILVMPETKFGRRLSSSRLHVGKYYKGKKQS